MAKKHVWSLERIQEGLKRFHSQYKHYPTATEFDEYAYLPRAKTIERRFGGIIELRKKLGLGADHDLRVGTHSSNRARMVTKRAHEVEKKVYDMLIGKFGRQFVHREFFFTDDHRTRADFFVYDKAGGFCVDVFYPASLRNLTGCLNIKLTKYSATTALLPYPVVFLQMNREIDQPTLDAFVRRKKRGIPNGQHLLEWESFQMFCSSRRPLKVYY